MPHDVTVDNFRDDPLFPRIERAVSAILESGKEVAPIDVLMRMDILRASDVEEWRRGRVPCLEAVIHSNLTKLGRLLRILRMHAHDLDLVPRVVSYTRKGRHTRIPLRFSKSGNPRVEEAYARHFIWPGSKPFSERKRRDEGGGG